MTWADRWGRMHKWWSVRIGVIGAIMLAGIPELSNQFPNLAPTLLTWFSHSGQQSVPVAGVVLAVVARVVSQAAIIGAVRRLTAKKGGAMEGYDLDALAELVRDEDERLTPYRDSVGKLTIGVGHNLDDNGIPQNVSRTLLAVIFADAEDLLNRNVPWWSDLDDVRMRVMLNS